MCCQFANALQAQHAGRHLAVPAASLPDCQGTEPERLLLREFPQSSAIVKQSAQGIAAVWMSMQAGIRCANSMCQQLSRW